MSFSGAPLLLLDSAMEVALNLLNTGSWVNSATASEAFIVAWAVLLEMSQRNMACDGAAMVADPQHPDNI